MRAMLNGQSGGSSKPLEHLPPVEDLPDAHERFVADLAAHHRLPYATMWDLSRSPNGRVYASLVADYYDAQLAERELLEIVAADAYDEETARLNRLCDRFCFCFCVAVLAFGLVVVIVHAAVLHAAGGLGR
jgi:hypothetical protein